MHQKQTGVVICAVLLLIIGILGILSALGILIALQSLIFRFVPILSEIIVIISVILLIFGLLSIVVAYGIWKTKRWAKFGGIALAIISLIGFPIGTIIGIIILYFLIIDKETKTAFQ